MRRSTVDRRRAWLAAASASLIPLVALILLLAAPGTLEAKLAGILRGVCAQRPDHAIGFDGGTVVLEARMLGIFLGFAVAVLASWSRGHSHRSELPRGLIGLVLLLGIGLMAGDGINAALYDLGLPNLYAPRNQLRLATGLLCGLGMAGFIAPVVSFVLWRRPEQAPLYATWKELAWGAGWVAIAGFIIGLDLVPQAVLGVISALAVVGSFWLVSIYVAVLAWEGPGQTEGWADLGGFAAAGFLLTLAGLFAMSALRTWMESSLGLAWVV